MKQITTFFLEGESPTLMTPTDSTDDQNIVTIERSELTFFLISMSNVSLQLY